MSLEGKLTTTNHDSENPGLYTRFVRLRALLVVIGIVIPLSASAMQETVWDFTDSQIPGEWEINGWPTPEPRTEGLRLTSKTQGMMIRTIDSVAIDAVRVEAITQIPTQAILLLHPKGGAYDKIYQVPFMIGIAEEGTISLDLSFYKETGNIDRVGIALPPDADVILRKIILHQWNVAEKMKEVFLSFWTPAKQLPYSINFLWGPLMVTNPVARMDLYSYQPPHAHSGVWILLGITGILLIAAGVMYFLSWKKERFGLVLLLALIVPWVIFDLRMSFEIASYLKDDLTQYVLSAQGERTFRNAEEFNDLVEETLPLLGDDPDFVLVTPYGPYYGVTRYVAYPHEPLKPEAAKPDEKNWLVVFDPNTSIDDQGRLVAGDRVLTPPGKVIFKKSNYLFFFQVNP